MAQIPVHNPCQQPPEAFLGATISPAIPCLPPGSSTPIFVTSNNSDASNGYRFLVPSTCGNMNSILGSAICTTNIHNDDNGAISDAKSLFVPHGNSNFAPPFRNGMMAESSWKDANAFDTLEIGHFMCPEDEKALESAKQHEEFEQQEAAERRHAMSSVSDLCKYNKICYQYRLLGERGPAHRKIFTVELILGRENAEKFSAEGGSIKEAQQAAALKAIRETKLPKPKPRMHNNTIGILPMQIPGPSSTGAPISPVTGTINGEVHPGALFSRSNKAFSPTVQLNALGHRLGFVPDFKNCPQPYVPPYMFAYSKLGFPFIPPPATVSLHVGNQEFIGQGRTRQLAKHHAAIQALRFFEQNDSVSSANPQDVVAGESDSSNGTVENVRPKAVANDSLTTEDAIQKQLQIKSPVSLIYEVALQLQMEVKFEVAAESGPAHVRQYAMRCVVTDMNGNRNPLVTEGHGASKRQAKTAACEQMLQMLKRFGPLPLPSTKRRSPPIERSNSDPGRSTSNSKRKTNIVKDVKMDPNYGEQINPVSRLIQVQQAKGESDPRFMLMRETGQARSKEFIVKVIIGDIECEGSGPNKRLAKRNAAEAMLSLLGYAKLLPPPPEKPALKRTTSAEEENLPTSGAIPNSETRRVKFDVNFIKDCIDDSRSSIGMGNRQFQSHINFSPEEEVVYEDKDLLMFSIAQEMLKLLQFQRVPKDDSYLKQSTAYGQLHNLSDTMNFPVVLNEYPQELVHGSEFLCVISLPSLIPPRVCHGMGESKQLAREQAALAALRVLAQLGVSHSSQFNLTEENHNCSESPPSPLADDVDANSVD